MTYQNINDIYANIIKNGGGFKPTVFPSLRSDLVEVYDLTGANADFTGFTNCCTDGRYIYLNPNNRDSNGYAVRYDTTASFTASGSYESVSLEGVNADYLDFQSSCFDGRYVYYINYYGVSAHVGNIGRYDTRAAFSSGNFSWIDLSGESTYYTGNNTSVVTEDSLYIVSYYNNSAYRGRFLKYDFTDSFTAGNFSAFDLTTISADYAGYTGACYDGRYIYISPWTNNTNKHGNVIRYDTTASHTSSSSYEVLNLASLNAAYAGYGGTIFDGRYVWFIPKQNASNIHGYVAIYDTTKEFNTNSIEVIDLGLVDSTYIGYYGGCFDGENIYLTPWINDSGKHGNLIKINSKTRDVQQVDLGTINAAYKGYVGCTVVGDYLYLIPYENTSAKHGNFIRVRIKI